MAEAPSRDCYMPIQRVNECRNTTCGAKFVGNESECSQCGLQRDWFADGDIPQGKGTWKRPPHNIEGDTRYLSGTFVNGELKGHGLCITVGLREALKIELIRSEGEFRNSELWAGEQRLPDGTINKYSEGEFVPKARPPDIANPIFKQTHQLQDYRNKPSERHLWTCGDRGGTDIDVKIIREKSLIGKGAYVREVSRCAKGCRYALSWRTPEEIAAFIALPVLLQERTCECGYVLRVGKGYGTRRSCPECGRAAVPGAHPKPAAQQVADLQKSIKEAKSPKTRKERGRDLEIKRRVDARKKDRADTMGGLGILFIWFGLPFVLYGLATAMGDFLGEWFLVFVGGAYGLFLIVLYGFGDPRNWRS